MISPAKFVIYFSRAMWILLFVGMFIFARNNDDAVMLHLFPGLTWEAPLVLVLLTAFALGAGLGVLACLSRWVRQHREIQRLKRELRAKDPEARAKP